MADMDVHVCPACHAVWVEDSRMWREPLCCPACGYDTAAHVPLHLPAEPIDWGEMP